MTHSNDTFQDADGIDRRGFLECMAWAGTGMIWTVTGGVLSSQTFAQAAEQRGATASLRFAQISDSHIGFKKAANSDVAGTLQEALDRLNALPDPPAFLLHTGDITQLARPEEFDTADQRMRSAKVDRTFYVPGEHDVAGDNGKEYRERYGKDAKGDGWYSFDRAGIHFIGLVNVMEFKAGGLGSLGREQLVWLEKDLKPLRSSTPIVVFAHIPLWMVYPAWGWGTADCAAALALLKRFGSVTVLNGHIHQTMQKVEGHVTFHTAASTAFPQPAPGAAAGPGPMVVPADKLKQTLGITTVNYVKGSHHLAVVDSPLS